MSSHSNIALTGFMGVGKSMVSKKLSTLLDRPVISTDAMVIERAGMPIADIFREYGEQHFRQLEAEVIQDIGKKTGVIIDCGGGILLNPENVTALKQHATLIYLKASPDCILENLQKTDGFKKRPLLDVDDPLAKIKTMMTERQAYYEQAQMTIDADFKTIDEITESVLKAVNND
ncbi:MAG: shikimate kinase [Candidatus Omnitrophica bacterium]|nr:shikimate kinase [Candidatus Omnitrophota bacterium]